MLRDDLGSDDGFELNLDMKLQHVILFRDFEISLWRDVQTRRPILEILNKTQTISELENEIEKYTHLLSLSAKTLHLSVLYT